MIECEINTLIKINALILLFSMQQVPIDVASVGARDLIIPYKDIEILGQIASGGSGVVLLGLWKRTRVAVKKYYTDRTESSAAQFLQEARLHK